MTEPPPDRDDPLRRAAAWREEGHRVALATVIRTWGSSPRPAGSHLAARDDDAFVGSVSGGCVEGAVIEASEEVLESGEARTLEFGVSDEEAWALGLACGGRVEIRVEPLMEPPLLRSLLEERRRKRPVLLVTRLDDGERWLLGIAPGRGSDPPGDPGRAGGEPPGGPGDGPSPEVVTLHGEGPPPGGERLLSTALDALASDRTVVAEGETGPVLLRPYLPPPRLILVGAVHIARSLARLAPVAGFGVTVVDPRRAFADPERFPGTKVVAAWPGEALPELRIDRRTAVVTLTHDPKLDDPALAAALRSPAFYVGALGSSRTHRRRLDRLREEHGFDDAALSRIRGPVGLDIGARTPEEIAVAILAEAVAHLRGAAAP